MLGRKGLDERGARRIAHLIEATYVAYGDARTRVKHMKTRDPGIESEGERGTSYYACLSSNRKDPEMMSCLMRMCRATFGLDKAESGTSKAVVHRTACTHCTHLRKSNFSDKRQGQGPPWEWVSQKKVMHPTPLWFFPEN
jgi:hypothetical protein